jgi:hypothetical protein
MQVHLEDSVVRTSSGESFACDDYEAIQIPFGAQGEFKGNIEFNFDCVVTRDAEGKDHQNKKHGNIPVTCRESFQVMSPLTEFLGDQAFTTPELQRLAKDLGTLE